MQIARIVVATILCWLLFLHTGRNAIAGIRTGVIRYADKECRRRKRPIAFWSLQAFNSVLSLATAWLWIWVMTDALKPR
jgi:hypothetical protein